MHLSRATLGGAMLCFWLQFSSREIGPQNNCSTADENLDAAMSYTSSTFLQ